MISFKCFLIKMQAGGGRVEWRAGLACTCVPLEARALFGVEMIFRSLGLKEELTHAASGGLAASSCSLCTAHVSKNVP